MVFSSDRVRRLTDHARIEDEFLRAYHGNYYDGLPNGDLWSRVETLPAGAGFSYSSWAYPSVLGYDPVDYVRIVFPLDMRPAEFTIGSRSVQLTELGHVVAGGRAWHIRRPRGSDSIALRLDEGMLISKLGALLGERRDRIDLVQPASGDSGRVLKLRASVLAFLRELDLIEAPFVGSFTSEWVETLYEQVLAALCTEVLALDGPPPAPSNAQLGRVEQYLAEHFAETVTVERLAQVSGVSARSLHHHFRARHGCGVRDYVQRLRLEMARLRLSVFKTGRAIEEVALECGFHGSAALQSAYVQRYGSPLQGRTATRLVAVADHSDLLRSQLSLPG